MVKGNQNRKRRVNYKTYRFKGVVEIFVQKINVDGIEFDVTSTLRRIKSREADLIKLF